MESDTTALVVFCPTNCLHYTILYHFCQGLDKTLDLWYNKQRTSIIGHMFDKKEYYKKYRGVEENATRMRQGHKEYSKRLRLTVLSFYSCGLIQCTCCGEKEIKFLCLDHIDGGGNKHRKEVGYGVKLYLWIIKHGFPPIFQVLCHNCNLAKGFYGECPHSTICRS